MEVKSIPLFIKDNKNTIHIIDSHNQDTEVYKDNTFVYVGKKLDFK